MPGFCTPWPGKSSAIGPLRAMPMSPRLHPLEERGAPREAGPEAGEQHVVALLHPALADRLLERERDGRAGSVAVLVDVDGDALERQADAPRRGVDDSEVGLVRNPQVDLVESATRLLANLVGLPDEDVDRELDDV